MSTAPKGDRVGVSDSAASARGEHGACEVHGAGSQGTDGLRVDGGSGLPSSAEALGLKGGHAVASNFHNCV